MKQAEIIQNFAKYLDLLYNTTVTYLAKNVAIVMVINTVMG